MNYGSESLVKEEIEKLSNLNIIELFNKLNSVNNEINNIYNEMKNCKSDLCYWGYVARYEETKEIKEYLDNKILDYLKENNSKRLNSLVKTEENLKKIYKNKYKKIKGLEEYKPVQYKKKIELIESIFDYSE